MKNVLFQVVDEPYCLWEEDLKAHTLTFLNGFDTGYFDHLLEIHLNADDEARSAMVLRVAYHHAMETLFSFLGAFLQAPSKCTASLDLKVPEQTALRTYSSHIQQ